MDMVDEWCLRNLYDVMDLTGPEYRVKTTVPSEMSTDGAIFCH